MNDRLALEPILGRLRDFQRSTVEYVFQRLYLDSQPARRFLVADEVGLGKTMVARGLIAKTIRHLEDKVDRIDIVYVCSNAAIARQNLNRLNVYGNRQFAMATRLTLLPAHLKGLKANKVNFVSFTPGTTFDLKTRAGIMEERRLLYQMLREEVDLGRTGLRNVLQATAGRKRWRDYAEQRVEIDPDLKRLFLQELRGDRALLTNVQETVEVFHRARDFSREEYNRAYAVVSSLRRALARVCVSALEPDLVILDEFQRFKELLDGEDEAAQLAQALFRQSTARVLLLSATPYKMLTLNHETDEDHYEDFRRTLEFLFGSREAVAEVVANLDGFRRALHGLGQRSECEAESARALLESSLRGVMVRTERVPVTEQADAMVAEPPISAPIKAVDLKQAILVDRVSRVLKAWDAIEYWKSSPYLLNVMKEYELKRLLRDQMKRPCPDLVDALARGQDQLLRRGQFERYRQLEPANGRLRALLNDTVDSGQWQLLWVPPSMPYWQPSGAYADQQGMTKSLVFSGWQVVPDGIAVFCSYEAERRMLSDEPGHPRYSALVKSRKPLLRFSSSTEDRLSGMPVLALLYPSATLARVIDPVAVALELSGDGAPPAIEQVKKYVADQIAFLLQQTGHWPLTKDGRDDQRWYWAALALLDARFAPWMKPWCLSAEPNGWGHVTADSEEEPSSGFARHAAHFAEVFDGPQDLGRAPDDLLDVLAEIALASPAVCALRGLRRVTRWVDFDEPAVLHSASRIGEGFRSLFNLPETTALLRADETKIPYWRRTLEHALGGNLAAALDEYLHWLRESLGLVDQNAIDTVVQIADTVSEALSLRTSRLEIDQVRIQPRRGSIAVDPFGVRCRFAMRFGNVRSDQDDKIARTETVQKAFNSPFRPFVLATTSIGQEGLDFHPYCHRVYHWNLPSNPVDLEQREGRIHRYKGHAIRKNVAVKHGLSALRGRYRKGDDPWAILFEAAAADRAPGTSDLVPYWVYPIKGGARVERRIPMLPFSREQQRLPDLKASLAVYRLVFGQPRQEDLLAHLKGRRLEDILRWRVSLAPPALLQPTHSRAAEISPEVGGSLLYCHRCGDVVAHACDSQRQNGDHDLHWQSGDLVTLFYRAKKNGGPEYCRGEVEAVNGNEAEVAFEDFVGILRYRGADSFWDTNSGERCRLVSHRDVSGGASIALVCPKCGTQHYHTCSSCPKPFSLSWQTGDRLAVTYAPQQGIEFGTFSGALVRAVGRVARIHLEYADGNCEPVHIAHQPDGTWLDVDYGVRCDVRQVREPI
jgi:hypothetical protein